VTDLASHTITISGTPAFSSAFFFVVQGTVDLYGITWSGSATGVRWNVSNNGVLASYGTSTTTPGNSAGSTSSGGQVN
jgi:hypothetical protein